MCSQETTYCAHRETSLRSCKGAEAMSIARQLVMAKSVLAQNRLCQVQKTFSPVTKPTSAAWPMLSALHPPSPLHRRKRKKSLPLKPQTTTKTWMIWSQSMKHQKLRQLLWKRKALNKNIESLTWRTHWAKSKHCSIRSIRHQLKRRVMATRAWLWQRRCMLPVKSHSTSKSSRTDYTTWAKPPARSTLRPTLKTQSINQTIHWSSTSDHWRPWAKHRCSKRVRQPILWSKKRLQLVWNRH